MSCGFVYEVHVIKPLPTSIFPFPADAPNPMGFSMMVNQRLLPPTFPRSTKIKDRQLSIQYLTELIQRIKHACKIANCTSYHAALVSSVADSVVAC